jgi:hypothetical protein
LNKAVIVGLDPTIQPAERSSLLEARVKPEHDGFGGQSRPPSC